MIRTITTAEAIRRVPASDRVRAEFCHLAYEALPPILDRYNRPVDGPAQYGWGIDVWFGDTTKRRYWYATMAQALGGSISDGMNGNMRGRL